MFSFLNQNITPAPAQDVEMGIGSNVSGPPSIPAPIPPQKEEMQLAPEIVLFMEKQKETIETCMTKLAQDQIMLQEMERQLADMKKSADQQIMERDQCIQEAHDAWQEVTAQASEAEKRARELENIVSSLQEQVHVDQIHQQLNSSGDKSMEESATQVVGNSSHDTAMNEPVSDERRRLNDDDTDMGEVPSNNHQRPTIPKPTPFQRPRGGAPLKPSTQTGITEQSGFKTLLHEIQKTQNMVLNYTKQESGRHTTPRQRRPREFKPPAKRNRDADRTETLGWLRRIMNELMQIKHDKDILKDNDLYEPNTPKKRKMASYEKNQDMPGPDLQPMSPNWDEIDGNWNEALFRLFIEHCKESGDGDEIITDEAQYDIHEMFIDRLQRLKNLIKRCQPKGDELLEDYEARMKLKKEGELKRQRHHSRRGEDSPEDPETEETAIWENSHMMLDALRAGGISSDESDTDDSGHSVYRTKTMAWRAKDVLKKLMDIDSNRNTTNAYGNTRAGNPPRVRKRRDRLETSRPAIPGLPLNFYDSNWYAGLTPGQKRELGAKEERPLLFFD